MPRYSKTEVAESLARLRKLCPPGTTVYTTLRHVSRSGMLREISLHVIKRSKSSLRKTDIVSITWDVARVLGCPLKDGAHWVLRVRGCGMDMGFHVVNSLSYYLHGYDARGADALDAQRRGVPHTPRRGHFRPGYSLTHEWI